MAELLPGEETVKGQDTHEVDRVRKTIADVYTFVRSQEINRTIGSFTFDHYIDEAKRQIQGDGRGIRDAAGRVFDIRLPKLELLESLEIEFRETISVAEKLAMKADEEA